MKNKATYQQNKIMRFKKALLNQKKKKNKTSKIISNINIEIKKLTQIKNRLLDDNDGLRDKNGHLKQEIILLRELLDLLEKENTKLKNRPPS